MSKNEIAAENPGSHAAFVSSLPAADFTCADLDNCPNPNDHTSIDNRINFANRNRDNRTSLYDSANQDNTATPSTDVTPKGNCTKGSCDSNVSADPKINPEAVILHAMSAYDNLGRRMVMDQRGKMTKSQVDALMALNLFGSLTMTQISNHLAVSKEQASRTIGPLVAQGLLQRTRRLDNQRIVEVSLTKPGERLINESWRQVLQTLRVHLEPLTTGERAQLINASQQALDVLRKLLNDPH